MSKNITGARIKVEKDIIIKMYNNGVPIVNIAREYGVVSTSLWRHLKKWGIEVKRKPYQHRPKRIIRFKLKKSLKLQARMAENSRINDIFIKPCKFEHAAEDQKLVSNIINHPIIG